MGFEWDDGKADLNIERHGIDFRRASELFDGRHTVVIGSPRGGEPRWVATGRDRDEIWTVAFILRGENIRIISARRAHKREKERYYRSLLG